MAKRLFVGSLPYSTTEGQLSELFSQHGAVEDVKIITDRATGRSKGFGFVEMSSEAEAQEAVQKLNGYEMEGRKIVVNEAKPLEERPRGDRGPSDRPRRVFSNNR